MNFGSVFSIGAPVIAVAGSVAYLLLRFSYAEFYDHFGVAPEEVGLSRGEVLAQAALGLLLYVAWATLVAVLLVVLLLCAGFVVYQLASLIELVRPEWEGFVTNGVRRVKRRLGWVGEHGVELIACVVVVLWFGIAWALIPLTAGRLGEQAARDGRAISAADTTALVEPGVPVFDARVVPIDDAWPLGSEGLPKPLQEDQRRCTLYLGVASGTMLLYNVPREVLIRLPSSSAALEFHSDDPPDLPDDCRAPVE